MECKNCFYCYKLEGEDFPRCHWCEHCPGDKAPCEYDDFEDYDDCDFCEGCEGREEN